MEGYKKRSRRRKVLINRIILVLNVIILGVNIVFAIKNVKDYEITERNDYIS